MPTTIETDLDARYEKAITDMARRKDVFLTTPGYLEIAIDAADPRKKLILHGILCRLAEQGTEYATPGFDQRMKEDSISDLIELGELIEGIVEDYLDANE